MSDYKLVAIIPFLLIFIIENLRKPIGVGYISESMDKNILASSLSAESQLSSIMTGIYAFLISRRYFNCGQKFIDCIGIPDSCNADNFTCIKD